MATIAPDTIRVFVGGTPEHHLATKVLEFSIRRRTQSRVEFTPIWDTALGKHHPWPKGVVPITGFSFQRFLIPELCGCEGRAIYFDSDQIVLADIREMWSWVMPVGIKVLCARGRTDVMLIDNTVGWDIRDFVQKINDGMPYHTLMKLVHETRLQRNHDRRWDCTDKHEADCKLLHYTDMGTQPWLRSGHPEERIWLDEIRDALVYGFITPDEILHAVHKKQVRPSMAKLVGHTPPYPDKQFKVLDYWQRCRLNAKRARKAA